MAVRDRIYELISIHTTDLVCIHDSENTIRFATPSSKSIMGYDANFLIGKKLTDFLSQDFVDEIDFTTLIKFFDHPGSRIRYQILHGENRLRWLETTFTNIGDNPKEDYSILSSTRDITESVHLTDDLMNALGKEQELSRFKSNLYSVASHEFKTPLAVIQANIEMLKVKNSEKILKASLSSMEEEIDRLNSMIADMLELKKLTSGRTTFNPTEVDLKELIEDIAANDTKKAYPESNVIIKASKRSSVIIGDYSLLRYIFSNLLNNAGKFSLENHEIDVNIKVSDESILVSVKDHGVGVPAEEQELIFNSFYRAHNAGNFQGTGVGLSIVKEFVDLHKGAISLKSKINQGTTFFVSLPKT